LPTLFDSIHGVSFQQLREETITNKVQRI